MASAQSEMPGLSELEVSVLLAIHRNARRRAPSVSTGIINVELNGDPTSALISLRDNGYVGQGTTEPDMWILSQQGKIAAKELERRRQ